MIPGLTSWRFFWRPWYRIIIILKMWLYRIYALIGRLSAKGWIPHPKMWRYRIYALLAKGWIPHPKMWLYRSYALIGRLSRKIVPGSWKK